MKKIHLYNSLTKKEEEFKTVDGSNIVRIYSCGPTVYNYLHIGNLRAYVFADTLKRVLQYNGYTVKHIMNVTDIGHLTNDSDDGEDKMLNALKREGKPLTLKGLEEVSYFYFEKFREDFKKINIIEPEKFTFASKYIKEETEMVEGLLQKGFAYKTSDGIYFDTEKLGSYGRLGGAKIEEYSRLENKTEKKNPRDFALWKFSDENGVGFPSSLGKGFPGWHIECSAMSTSLLGKHFDIHTGGIDNAVPHHNNEIAQCEALNGNIFANFFMHNNHVTIKNDKMAKSEGNFITLNSLIEKGIDPLAYRYWLLQSRYSTRIDFSWEALEASKEALNKIIKFISEIENVGKIEDSYKEKFTNAINDDLDTPKVISILWYLIKDKNVSNEDKKATLLDFDNVLGLQFEILSISSKIITEEIQNLLDERKKAKENKDFTKSDKIRKTIEEKGFSLKDDAGGAQIITKNL